MTRVNVIPVQELTKQHLVAEYREIMRVPGALKKSLQRKKPFCNSEIPENYVLGKGHVKFFYNKLEYLRQRFEELVMEMKHRGYSPTYTDSSIFKPDTEELNCFYNNWEPTEEDSNLNRQRISERLSK